MNQQKTKSVREIALEKYIELKKAPETYEKIRYLLYKFYSDRFNEYYYNLKSPENWHAYAIARDLFLQFIGKINLETEIAMKERMDKELNNKSYLNKIVRGNTDQ